jgi:hypothetical protein
MGRYPRHQGRYAANVGRVGILAAATQDHIVKEMRVNARAFDDLFHDDSGQFLSRQASKSPPVTADRRAFGRVPTCPSITLACTQTCNREKLRGSSKCIAGFFPSVVSGSVAVDETWFINSLDRQEFVSILYNNSRKKANCFSFGDA